MQVTGHARNVEGSVRRIDEKRKNQREGRKESKEKEKRQKEAELKRLKSLKSQEVSVAYDGQQLLFHVLEEPLAILHFYTYFMTNYKPFFTQLQERLRQICEVSGLGEGGLSLEGVDLDEDWDPEKYEVREIMSAAEFFFCGITFILSIITF